MRRLCKANTRVHPSASGLAFHFKMKGMLELRPSCECCDKNLPPAAEDAMICTFECTFCRDCVENRVGGRCPNCGGNFAPRPVRPAWMLVQHPPSSVRVLNPAGCSDSPALKD